MCQVRCERYWLMRVFFFQAEDGIRDAQESRGLGDVYKRQGKNGLINCLAIRTITMRRLPDGGSGVSAVG